jgi:hypothetical protein
MNTVGRHLIAELEACAMETSAEVTQVRGPVVVVAATRGVDLT